MPTSRGKELQATSSASVSFLLGGWHLCHLTGGKRIGEVSPSPLLGIQDTVQGHSQRAQSPPPCPVAATVQSGATASAWQPTPKELTSQWGGCDSQAARCWAPAPLGEEGRHSCPAHLHPGPCRNHLATCQAREGRGTGGAAERVWLGGPSWESESWVPPISCMPSWSACDLEQTTPVYTWRHKHGVLTKARS